MPDDGVEGVQTRLIGHDMEIQILKDTLHHILQSRESQIITIIGEAGVGKSRLLAEYLNWVGTLSENLIIFPGRSEQEKQNKPYALLLKMFSDHF